MLGTEWQSWNIAAFTTFLSCFVRMAAKSSKAAKLFNAVQRAEGVLKAHPASDEGAGTAGRSGELLAADVALENVSFA